MGTVSGGGKHTPYAKGATVRFELRAALVRQVDKCSATAYPKLGITVHNMDVEDSGLGAIERFFAEGRTCC